LKIVDGLHPADHFKKPGARSIGQSIDARFDSVEL
jgi:hypothetical protein